MGYSDAQVKVAVVGGGISGLSAAYALREHAHVTLFEHNAYVGGHTNTIDVDVNGSSIAVDTGFLVYNERTYPNLIRLFSELGVDVVASDMSFSVNLPELNLEWAGTNLDTVFAQRRNLLKPSFLRMVLDILKFNKAATAAVAGRTDHVWANHAEPHLSLGQYLEQQNYSTSFRDWYLLPMAAAIWSCPTNSMLDFPWLTFAQFCHNHGLLQVSNRPKWYTVKGGAKHYVEKLLKHIPTVFTNCPVRQVLAQENGKPIVCTDTHRATFDYVVMACHSDESKNILHGNPEQTELLSAIHYQSNVAYVHRDVQLMPKLKKAWASWNYISDLLSPQNSVSVTYWLNNLQPLPTSNPILVTLNPIIQPKPELTWREIHYSHPVFDEQAIMAQQKLPEVQGQKGVYLAGAWARYGFHEDGHVSGTQAALGIIADLRAQAQHVA